ncbi:pantoate--beta-alanine ligase [Pseudoroseomonas cervicalis]|uniref:pantoate--beta-alanine ligase n=1 Tax=Teichococcus cervicalis TaxID=204525 RepID=UPI0022F1B2ED|nr:pantoate--beta-alanine ligase [Pseudoroseomonas cervicalis]WBV41515.1 pantoate--beta-alanine ligase [Pseudoroseomonas cervicalis]
MRIERDLAGLSEAVGDWRRDGQRIALVPTMGALHDGHLALVAEARRHASRVAVSIFVNPLQFGPQEDLDRYPRDEAGDLEKLRRAGCDLAFLPTPPVLYPQGEATRIEPSGPAEGWEGAARPGHFRGVATVCTKLFLMCRADVAVFGEKDWQQLQVIRRTVADLHLPVAIIGLPTVRDADGLAMSSRNQRLSPAERAAAALLPAVLGRLAEALSAGAPPAPALAAAQDELRRGGFAPDYLALVEPHSLRPWPQGGQGPARLIVAARLGDVRLLDNFPVSLPPPG